MTPLQRDEMLLYRKHFIASETRMAAKTKARLLRRVEDVLAEIEVKTVVYKVTYLKSEKHAN